MLVARTKTLPIPEVGTEAPKFHLPSAQGGQLQLSMRTARGPVVVVFYSGGWSEEDVAYFKDLASKEDEINLAAASIVGIGRSEPQEARDFVRETAIKSYILYDYAGVATREYGLLQKDREHGEHARPATFIVDTDHKIVHAWVGERTESARSSRRRSERSAGRNAGLPKIPKRGTTRRPRARPETGPKQSPRTGSRTTWSIQSGARQGGEFVWDGTTRASANERTA